MSAAPVCPDCGNSFDGSVLDLGHRPAHRWTCSRCNVRKETKIPRRAVSAEDAIRAARAEIDAAVRRGDLLPGAANDIRHALTGAQP